MIRSKKPLVFTTGSKADVEDKKDAKEKGDKKEDAAKKKPTGKPAAFFANKAATALATSETNKNSHAIAAKNKKGFIKLKK